MPIEQHPDGPGPGVNLGVLKGGLVGEEVGLRAGDALDDVQRVAVEVSRPVKPCIGKIIRRVDDQRFAFPVPARIADPEQGDIGMLGAVHKNSAQRVGEFRGHQHELGRLHDLYRERQIHHARNSGDVTDVERIGLGAVLEILFLLLRGRRRVWNLAIRRIHDDAAARRACRVSRCDLQDSPRPYSSPARCLAGPGGRRRCAAPCRIERREVRQRSTKILPRRDIAYLDGLQNLGGLQEF